MITKEHYKYAWLNSAKSAIKLLRQQAIEDFNIKQSNIVY